MPFNPNTTPIDYVLLGGSPSPGVAVVRGDGPEHLWDKRRGPGLSGAVPVFTGLDLGEFTVELTLSTNEDWEDWAEWKELVQRVPYGKRPRALDIWHPWCEMHGIRACVVRQPAFPEDLGDGRWKITIKLLEYRKITLALAKPEAAAADKPTDPVDQLIERLSNQVQELSQ
jgi:hypothetical protein